MDTPPLELASEADPSDPPEGCGLDPTGCFVEGAHEEWALAAGFRKGVTRLMNTLPGGCFGFLYFAILPGVLFGFSAIFGVGMIDVLGLHESLLATPLTVLFMALFVLVPYGPLLFDQYAIPRLFRQTLRADARHVHFGDRRFARETTTLEQNARRLVLHTPDGSIHLSAPEDRLTWFLHQLELHPPEPLGREQQVPKVLHALRAHEPEP